jgi:hypothetical protein
VGRICKEVIIITKVYPCLSIFKNIISTLSVSFKKSDDVLFPDTGCSSWINFCFLAFKLNMSNTHEWTARMFALRSKTLETGIQNLINGEYKNGNKSSKLFLNIICIKNL